MALGCRSNWPGSHYCHCSYTLRVHFDSLPPPPPLIINGYEETYQNLTKSRGGGGQMQLQYTSTVAPTQGE